MPLTPEQYLRPDVIQQVRRLDLKARFIVEGFLAGLHRSPFHGFSVEFSEHRKYTPGDDLRRIDWGVYGKTDRYYIRKYQAETNVEAYLLVDASGSMGYAAGGRMTKMDYAICMAAALGYMMISQQDPVGLFVFDEKVRSYLPPKSKRTHLTNILSTLARTKPAGPTRLGPCLHEIAARIPKRSLVILLSDLLDAESDDPAADIEGVKQALHHFHHNGHDLIVFQVLDHSEIELDFHGPVRFEEPETHRELQVDPEAFRAAYQEELQTFLDAYRKQCQALRADFVPIDNAMTFDKALMEFLLQRQSRY
ncbi:MAG: DUF58 domain-containing protein [Phycisphaerae bacterium]|nr:DUF58 domain-containing protein [Phycisphaerae bacterium]